LFPLFVGVSVCLVVWWFDRLIVQTYNEHFEELKREGKIPGMVGKTSTGDPKAILPQGNFDLFSGSGHHLSHF